MCGLKCVALGVGCIHFSWWYMIMTRIMSLPIIMTCSWDLYTYEYLVLARWLTTDWPPNTTPREVQGVALAWVACVSVGDNSEFVWDVCVNVCDNSDFVWMHVPCIYIQWMYVSWHALHASCMWLTCMLHALDMHPACDMYVNTCSMCVIHTLICVRVSNRWWSSPSSLTYW